MTGAVAAPGSTSDYCSAYPDEPHHLVTHLRGGASIHVKRCSLCGWIDFDDLDQQAAGQRVVEHAQMYADGGMLVRVNNPRVERIYPLAEWIPDKQKHGGRIFRRTIAVVEDWTEVPR